MTTSGTNIPDLDQNPFAVFDFCCIKYNVKKYAKFLGVLSAVLYAIFVILVFIEIYGLAGYVLFFLFVLFSLHIYIQLNAVIFQEKHPSSLYNYFLFEGFQIVCLCMHLTQYAAFLIVPGAERPLNTVTKDEMSWNFALTAILLALKLHIVAVFHLLYKCYEWDFQRYNEQRRQKQMNVAVLSAPGALSGGINAPA